LETHETLKRMQNCETDRNVDSKCVQTNLKMTDIEQLNTDIDQLLNASVQTKSESSDETRKLDNLTAGTFWKAFYRT